MVRLHHFAIAFLVQLLTACPPSQKEPVLTPAASSTTQGSASKKSAVATPLPQLSDTETKALGDLMKKVIAECTMLKYVDSVLCPGVVPWREHELITSGKAEAWLLEQLRSEDHNVHVMAATGLTDGGTRYRTDRDLALLVIAAAQATPQDSDNPYPLGAAVGNIDAGATGLQQRIEKLLRSKAHFSVKQGMSHWLLKGDTARWLPVVLSIMKDRQTDRSLMAQALRLREMTAVHRSLACGALVEVAADASSSPNDVGVITEALLEGCGTAHRVVAFEVMELRAKAGTFARAGTLGLFRVFQRKDSSGEDKRRALLVARLLIDNSANPSQARRDAMGLLAKHSPTDGKAHIEKLAKGKPSETRELAKWTLGLADREQVRFSNANDPLWQQVDAVRACYKAALGQAPKRSGHIGLDYQIGASGRIGTVSVTFSNLPDATKRCVVKAIKKAKLQPSSKARKGFSKISFSLRD